MAYQNVISLDAEVTVALGKSEKKSGKPFPKEAEGYYLGKRRVESARGESNLHVLQFFTEDQDLRQEYEQLKVTAGISLGVWGTTDLDRKLLQVAPGTMIKITSTGTTPTKNGPMYTYRVQQDKDNTIEVSATPNYVSEDDDADSEETQSETETESDFNEEAYLAAQAERKARTEALLKGKGKQVTKN